MSFESLYEKIRGLEELPLKSSSQAMRNAPVFEDVRKEIYDRTRDNADARLHLTEVFNAVREAARKNGTDARFGL